MAVSDKMYLEEWALVWFGSINTELEAGYLGPGPGISFKVLHELNQSVLTSTFFFFLTYKAR